MYRCDHGAPAKHPEGSSRFSWKHAREMAIVALAVRRADSRYIKVGRPDSALTGYGGLARFGAFTRDLGVDRGALPERPPLTRHPRSALPCLAVADN